MNMAKGLAVVQQAIFTSARTDRSAGYQILAASPGLVEFDRRELAAWGPSHDSLLDAGPDAASVNFFPLPSGAFCVSRTAPAGWEYSGRGGYRIYTHCLIASPAALRQFANHPLLLLRAAMAGGCLEVPDEIPARLAPLELRETAPAAVYPCTYMSAGPLAQLAAEVGPASLAMLVQAALTNVCLAVRGPVAMDRLICGLLDCLPLDCRTSISFSTGLKFSARRPFDLLALPDDPAQQRWLANRPGVTELDLNRDPASARHLVHDWARLIHRLLSSGDFAFLSEELGKPRGDFLLTDLPVLGLQLLDEFESGRAPCTHGRRPPAGHPCTHGSAARQAHAAHRKFQKSFAAAPSADASVICAPSKLLDSDSPQVVARLEALDDAVFDAIQGKAAALADLHHLWPALKIELGDALLAESREQYIRYALSIWQEPASIEGNHDPARAVHALEVLCVLFDEVR
jgi:hypothetical protein